jgi:methylmalonyl-CoA/ethylmalonyl-CoA epimerase
MSRPATPGDLPLPGGSLLGKPVRQVALVVPDAEAQARAWWQHLGIGPWNLYTLDAAALTAATYRGQPADFRIRHALAFSGEVMMELVQPIQGPSIWHEHLEQKGAGLQHIAFYPDDFVAASAALAAEGWIAVASGDGFGRSRDGRFAYLEHPDVVGIIVEIVQAPTDRFPPEVTIPAAP